MTVGYWFQKTVSHYIELSWNSSKQEKNISSRCVIWGTEKMALVLLLITTVTCIADVGSAISVTTVTRCTSLINDQCRQNLTSCPLPPCSLSCGRTSPQFSCSQDCIPSANLTEGYLCNALECQASQFCYQTCSRINCNSSVCTSKNCNQHCWVADCGRMLCKENVTNCNQAAMFQRMAKAWTVTPNHAIRNVKVVVKVSPVT